MSLAYAVTHMQNAYMHRYPFNDTARSTTVRDYSGNGFHAKALSGQGGFPPIFTGDRVRLNSEYQQYLVINRTLGQQLKTLSSFSVTVSINIATLNTQARLFEWGVLGGSVALRACHHDNRHRSLALSIHFLTNTFVAGGNNGKVALDPSLGKGDGHAAYGTPAYFAQTADGTWLNCLTHNLTIPLDSW